MSWNEICIVIARLCDFLGGNLRAITIHRSHQPLNFTWSMLFASRYFYKQNSPYLHLIFYSVLQKMQNCVINNVCTWWWPEYYSSLQKKQNIEWHKNIITCKRISKEAWAFLLLWHLMYLDWTYYNYNR